MKVKLIVILLVVFFVSCNTKQEKIVPKEEMIMYVPSEMTVLMREMFEFQEKSKQQIKNGQLPLNFPEKFKKIHSAELSDQFERDASFKGYTDLYFQDVERLNNSTKETAKKNFNIAINTCIACHNTTCHGPIVRIKKLLIK